MTRTNGSAELLERDEQLGHLAAGARLAGRGDGQLVLLSGEAGIGKTSLLREFLRRLPPGTLARTGAGEDLYSPASWARSGRCSRTGT